MPSDRNWHFMFARNRHCGAAALADGGNGTEVPCDADDVARSPNGTLLTTAPLVVERGTSLTGKTYQKSLMILFFKTNRNLDFLYRFCRFTLMVPAYPCDNQ